MGRRWACYASTWRFYFSDFCAPTNVDEVVTVKEIEIVLPVFSVLLFSTFLEKQ